MSATELQKSLRRLSQTDAGWEPLKATPSKGARPGEVATGRPSSSGTPGADSLVESDYTLREYWDAVDLTSSDGLFTLEVRPIKKIVLEGSRTMEFKEPV